MAASMSDDPNDPYRRTAERVPTELERIAAQGERLRQDLDRGASSAAEKAGDYNLAVAIGGHYGTPLKRGLFTALGVLAVGMLATIVALVLGVMTVMGAVIGPALAVTVLLIAAAVLVPPFASKGQRDAEERWARSRPFPLTGYPAMLRTPPSIYARIQVSIAWAVPGSGPDRATLMGVVHGTDPSAEPVGMDANRASWSSGNIDGSTGVMVNRRIITRNHRLVGYVHDLVDKTLEPIHRSGAIARVDLLRVD